MSRCFWRGTYTSWQRGQKTFTRDVDSSSDRPMGRTTYRSHRIRWHMPKAPSRNFSRIMASPRGDRIKRACISPYKSIAAWYTSRKLEKHANRVIIRHVMNKELVLCAPRRNRSAVLKWWACKLEKVPWQLVVKETNIWNLQHLPLIVQIFWVRALAWQNHVERLARTQYNQVE